MSEQQTTFNAFDDNAWSEQPIVETKAEATETNEEGAAAKTESQEPATEGAKTVDFNSYLKEKFGFENAEHALREFQQLKEPTIENALKFENEESKKFFTLWKDGKEDDLYSFLTEKKKIEQLSNAEVTSVDVAADIVKFNLQKKYKDLSADEIEYKFNKQFGTPEKPEQGLDETDDEYEVKVANWEKQKRLAEKELIIEAKLLKPELEKYKLNLILPELPKAETPSNQPSQDELAKWEEARKQFENNLESSYKSFEGINVTAKNEEVEIPVSFVPTEDEKAALKEQLKSFDQNEYFGKRWINEQGQVKVEQMMKDIYLLENYEKAHQKLVNEAAAKMFEHQVKKLSNLEVNGGRQTTPSLEQVNDEQAKMTQYFFENS